MRDWTPEEEKAIASLNRLAKKWPDSLVLFSWSGSLVVFARDEYDELNGGDGHNFIQHERVAPEIINDGGDPT